MTVQPCLNTSVGLSENEEFNAYGQSSRARSNEDRCYTGMLNGIQLCMVLDGHDGEGAADFACSHLAGMLLQSNLEDGDEAAVRGALKQAFLDTETQFFVKIDDAVIRRQTLMEEMSVSTHTCTCTPCALYMYTCRRPSVWFKLFLRNVLTVYG